MDDTSSHCSRLVWNAAVCLLRFLEQEWTLDSPPCGITNVLELGSGTGWLGMTLARNVPSARIVLTEPDLFGCLDNLKRNVETNLDAGVVEAARVSCTPFDWSDTTAAVLLERWDLVLGSDLIYNRETVRLLLGRALRVEQPLALAHLGLLRQAPAHLDGEARRGLGGALRRRRRQRRRRATAAAAAAATAAAAARR